jgi:hypothetical protein
MFVRRDDVFKALMGYCGVPKGHRYYGIEYDDDALVHIVVHGGLTFSGGGTHGIFGYFWWFGFDCLHAGDLIPNSIYPPMSHAVYRDMAYVQAETLKLAAQLSSGGRALPDKAFTLLEKVPAVDVGERRGGE